MNLNEEELQMVEDLAAHFFTEKEVAEFMELDFYLVEQIFLSDKSHPIYRSYMKGWMQAEFELRKGIKTLSTSGSHPAQTMLQEIMRKASTKRIKK